MEALVQILGTFAAVFITLSGFYWQSRRDRKATEAAREEAENAAKSERENAFNLLQQDHDNLKEQVGKIETDTKALIGGQNQLQGSMDTLLSFIKPVVTEGTVGKSAD